MRIIQDLFEFGARGLWQRATNSEELSILFYTDSIMYCKLHLLLEFVEDDTLFLRNVHLKKQYIFLNDEVV